MAKYLISTSETYRVDSEKEAEQLIQDNKSAKYGELIKYSSIYKDQKQKGEIIQQWYRVTLTKVFDDEREPCDNVKVEYNKEGTSNEY